MSQTDINVTRKVGSLCARIKFDSLDSEVVDRAKYLLLDFLGCAIRGSLTESSGPALSLADQKISLYHQVPIVGTGVKSEPSYSALAMGTAAHSLELDDVVNSASLHPAVSVMPAALATGYVVRCSGARLIEAIVTGYELMVKLGIAVNPSAHYRQGFHPTGTCGTFGAAIASARILNLDEPGLINAIGIAGSQAAGSLEFLTDGSFTKRFHAGWSAHSGMVAANLASKGFSGPATIIEGKFGFLHGYSQKSDPQAVTADWGRPWEVMNTSIKPHACCRYKQGPIDCILELVKEHNLKPEDIAQVEIGILDAGFALVAEPEEQKINPQSIVDAQFSMPFGAALAIVRKNAFLDRYSLSEIGNSEIKELMKKVRCVRDPELNREYPRKWPARVAIKTVSGSTLNHYLEHPKGDPENPLSWDELIHKFNLLAMEVVGPAQCERIVKMVRQLEQSEDVATFIDGLQVE